MYREQKMFENVSKKDYLAGYTGYIPQFKPEDFTGTIQGPSQQIPGKFGERG